MLELRTLLGAIPLAVAVAVACPAAVSAQTAPARESHRMTLPKGTLLAQGFIEVNLSADNVIKPVSLSPDIWYGLNDDLSLGLVHSAPGSGGFYGGVGTSLCLTGEDNGCGAGVYHNLGLDARYNLLEGVLPLAVDGGVFISDFDPFLLALKVGLVGKWQGPIAVIFNPNLSVGITERDAGNEEVFSLPLATMYEITPKISVGLQTGIVLPFTDVGNLWRIPLSVGGRFLITGGIWAEAAFTLPAVAGGDGITNGFDARVLTVGGGVVL
ncbi:hypothetical protein [Haliangium sp.]|uniref:hypothetical protein n=1 Tax=Haliangium sp. TaxID=2663208 RepID=UPI003D0A02AF